MCHLQKAKEGHAENVDVYFAHCLAADNFDSLGKAKELLGLLLSRLEIKVMHSDNCPSF
jgi:hypothetical protein